MLKTYYMVGKREEGSLLFVKDPLFCRKGETPFKAYTKQNDDQNAFLPWTTLTKETAEAQAALLGSIDNIPHFVAYANIDFDKLLNMDTQNIKPKETIMPEGLVEEMWKSGEMCMNEQNRNK